MCGIYAHEKSILPSIKTFSPEISTHVRIKMSFKMYEEDPRCQKEK